MLSAYQASNMLNTKFVVLLLPQEKQVHELRITVFVPTSVAAFWVTRTIEGHTVTNAALEAFAIFSKPPTRRDDRLTSSLSSRKPHTQDHSLPGISCKRCQEKAAAACASMVNCKAKISVQQGLRRAINHLQSSPLQLGRWMG